MHNHSAILPPAPASARESQPSVLFLLHDAGETKALLPVMQALEKRQVSYAVFADATAKRLLKGNPHLLPLARTSREDSPRFVVTGLASSFQKQWAVFYKQHGIPVIGYYDSFYFNPNANPAQNFLGLLDALITPSADTARLLKSGFPEIPVLGLGQPTLESIPSAIRQSNPVELSEELGLTPGKPTILFAGSYGPGYRHAFTLFCKAIETLPSGIKPQGNLLLSLHPKTSGILERTLLERHHLTEIVSIAPKRIATDRILRVTDAVLSYNSVLPLQALFQGKKILLLGRADPHEFNPLVTHGLATRLQSVEALSTALHAAIHSFPDAVADKNDAFCHASTPWHALLGIPQYATRNITRYLMSILAHDEQANYSPDTACRIFPSKSIGK